MSNISNGWDVLNEAWRLSNALLNTSGTAMEKYRLHPKSLIVLGVYQNMTQPSLVSRHLHIPMPTLSNIHRELEKNGLLTKQIDVEDRRRHIMKLTPLGSEAVNTCLTKINKFYDSKKSEITPADT